MPTPACREFLDDVVDLVAGGLPPDRSRVLEAHATECPVCAATFRRERALAARLAGIPDAPDVVLPVPAIPEREPGRLLRIGLAWAAGAAAAVLFAYWAGTPGDRAARDVAGDPVLRVIDDTSPFPAWDERLLGLSAGVETVAAARPASR